MKLERVVMAPHARRARLNEDEVRQLMTLALSQYRQALDSRSLASPIIALNDWPPVDRTEVLTSVGP
ncbi:MAG TPA: hypothetical protein VGC32_01010 [Solirubrobacterales bacterium]